MFLVDVFDVFLSFEIQWLKTMQPHAFRLFLYSLLDHMVYIKFNHRIDVPNMKTMYSIIRERERKTDEESIFSIIY